MTSRKKNNHSILVENILHGLRGACCAHPGLYDEAETEFFYWLTKKENPIAAETKALAWVHLVLFLAKAIPLSASLLPKHLVWTEEIEDDLVAFFQKRQRVWAKDNEDKYELGVLLGKVGDYK